MCPSSILCAHEGLKGKLRHREGQALAPAHPKSQRHSSQSPVQHPWKFPLWAASINTLHPAWCPALLSKSSYYPKLATDLIPGHPESPLTTYSVMLPARASSRGPCGISNLPMPLFSPAMNNPPGTSTSQTQREKKAAWPSIDTRQMMGTQEHGLGLAGPRNQRLGWGMWGFAWSLPSLPCVQVNNLGQRVLPVSIYFSVPVELNQVAVWKEIEVFHPQVCKYSVMPFTWIPCVSLESLMVPLRCLLSVFS